MNPGIAALFLSLLLPLAAVAQDVGSLTIRDGNVRVIRGAWVLRVVEGMPVRLGDIVETPEAGFAQLEFPGSLLAIGPSSRVYLFGRGAGTTQVVLISGWLKAQTSPSAGTYRYLTPLASAATRDGSIVLRTTADAASIFVESGSASVGADGRATGQVVKAGQFVSRAARKPVTVSARLPDDFVQSMPIPFRDTLPARAQRFAGKRIEPVRDHEVTYPEVAAWLSMPAAWRRGMVSRFEPRLEDASFRSAVDAHMHEHPEWDPVVHPEKYRPKTQPASADAGTPPAR